MKVFTVHSVKVNVDNSVIISRRMGRKLPNDGSPKGTDLTSY